MHVNDVTNFSFEVSLWHKDGLRSVFVGESVIKSVEMDFSNKKEHDIFVSLSEKDKSVLKVRVALSPGAVSKYSEMTRNKNPDVDSVGTQVGVFAGEAFNSVAAPAPFETEAADPASPPRAPGEVTNTTAAPSSQTHVTSTEVDPSRIPGTVRLKIMEAKDLGQGRPLSVFALIEEYRNDKNKVLKTKTQKGSNNPVWGEEFEFEVPAYDKWSCTISVWDTDILRSTRIGHVTLQGSQQPGDVWLDLEGGDGGSVHVVHAVNFRKRGVTALLTPVKLAVNPMRKVIDRIGNHAKDDGGEFNQGGMVSLRVGNGEGFKAGGKLQVRLDKMNELGTEALVSSVLTHEPLEWHQNLVFSVENAEAWSCNVALYDGDTVIGSVTLSGTMAPIPEHWYPMGPGRIQLGTVTTLKNFDPAKRQSLASVMAASKTEQHGPGVVKFLVFEGDNLLPREGRSDVSEGYCDAYLRIDAVHGGTLSGKKKKTKVVPKTIYPRWDEEFSFTVEDVGEWSVDCSVWHKPFVGQEKPQGHFSVKGVSTPQHALKIPLIDGKGSVSVGFNVVSDETRNQLPLAESSRRIGLPKFKFPGTSTHPPEIKEIQGENPGFVLFYIYEGTNLMAKDANGSSDPFAVILNTTDIDGKDCKTKVLKKTLSPKWNDVFTFQVPNLDRWAVRIQVWDWDMLGKDKLGYCDVLGSSQQQPKQTYDLIEGSGSISVGWSVSKVPPSSEDIEVEQKVSMPAERRGRLKVTVKSAENLPRPCATLVRLVEGALDCDKTKVAEATDRPEWNDKLEIDVPDMASWSVQLNLCEVLSDQSESVLGSVVMQADKFNLAGSTDYKTLPLSGDYGDITVGIAAVRQYKRLATQIYKAKGAMQAEEMRRARIRGKTMMQLLGADGRNGGDIEVKLLDAVGGEGQIYATVEGAKTPAGEVFRSQSFRIGDTAGWDETFFLRIGDLANFSFTVNIWEAVNHVTGVSMLTKIFSGKEHLIGSACVSSLDVDFSQEPEAIAPLVFTLGAEGRVTLRMHVAPTPKTQEIGKRLKVEDAEEAAKPLAWPEERAGVMRLHVIRGEDLAAADIGGTSDPYVQITGLFDANGEHVKSRIIKKTLNPYWDQWFDIPIPDLAGFDLTLGLWDHDIGMDDTLGYVPLRAEDWDFADEEHKKKLAVVNGEGFLEIGLAPTLHSRRLLRKIRAARQSGLAPVSAGGFNRMVKSKLSGVLQLTIISANALSAADRNGLSDPYVLVPKSFFTDTKGREIRTKVIRRTLSPEWNEVFEFWTPNVRQFNFQLSLWDWDLGRHDSLGFAVVRSQDWIEFSRTGKERRVLKVEDGEGELFIEISASEGAMRVLEMMRKEDEEAEMRKITEQLRKDREQRLKNMARDHLHQLRDLIPQYERKNKILDPMWIVAAVLLVLTILHLAWVIYSNTDRFVAGAISFAQPFKATGYGIYRGGLWIYTKVKGFFV